MLDPTWTLVIGLPIIAILLVIVWRRTQAVTARIREVQEEMACNPQDPYRALAELMAQEKADDSKRGRKRAGGEDG